MERKGKERDREREREEGVYGWVTSERREGGKEKHGEKSVVRIRGVLARDGSQLSSRRENNGNYPR